MIAADGDGVVGDSTYAKDEQISRRKAKVAALVEDGWRSRGL